MAQLKRAVGGADQAGDLQAEMRHDFADFAILAFLERDDKPRIGPLCGPSSWLPWARIYALNGDALSESRETLGLYRPCKRTR